ncbi:MAG: alpha/beta hydrolase-fold protein [Planctomycetota bacterium]
MRFIGFPIVLIAFLVCPALAKCEPLYADFDAFRQAVLGLARIDDETERADAVDAFWDGLVAAEQVPYRQGDQVAWLHRSSGTVAFAGDFNRWNPERGAATRIPGTDLWVFDEQLPEDARVEYKVVQNGSWILDPANPHRQWSGFGPNSELRMPAYVPPAETTRSPGVPRGSVSANIRLDSDTLGSEVNVRVYTPAGYDADDALPVVYFTDGHEYLEDRLGAATAVLDNMIHSDSLRPTMAVFIDPRDPQTGANRRLDQMAGDQRTAFATFVADELVAYIDANFGTAAEPGQRTLMGTSVGGLFAAYMGTRHSDVFGNLAIQSPSLWLEPELVNAYRDRPELAEALRVYLSVGTINDNEDDAAFFAGLLDDGDYDFRFDRVNQGHAWGHWRGKVDDALIFAVGGRPIPEPNAAAGLLGFTLLTTARGHRRWGLRR